MFLPGIGFVGNKIMAQRGEGRSFESGFYLDLITHENTLSLKTRNLDLKEVEKENSEKSGLKILDIFLMAAVLFAVYWGVVSNLRTAILEPWTSLLSTFLATPCILILASLWRQIIKVNSDLNPNLKEWHSCEHKSLMLLKSGLEPSVSNLNKCPASLINCGFASTTVEFGLLASVWMTGITAFKFINASPVILLLSAFYFIDFVILIFFVNYLMPEILNDKRPERNPFFWLFYLITLPIILPVAFLEKILVLKAPSTDKLEETALVLREFIQHNQIYRT